LIVEYLDDFVNRWSGVASPDGPLGLFILECGNLRPALCLFHVRQSLSRILKETPLPLPRTVASTGQTLLTGEVDMSRCNASVAPGPHNDSESCPRVSPVESASLRRPGTSEFDELAASVIASVVPVSYPPAEVSSSDPYHVDSTLLENTLRELQKAHSSILGQHSVASGAVQLMVLDAICERTKGENIQASKEVLAALLSAWPAIYDYCKRYVFSLQFRSLICLPWRLQPHSSNANVIPESANNVLKNITMGGLRSNDPATALKRVVGSPNCMDDIEGSFANSCARRNALRRYKAGSTDAALRRLRTIHRAAEILAKAWLGLDGTTISPRSTPRSAFGTVVDIYYTGVRTVFQAYQSGQLRKNKKAHECADLVGQSVQKSDLQISDCPSSTARNWLLMRQERHERRISESALRVKWSVDVTRNICLHCGFNGRCCSHCLASAAFAQYDLKRPPSLLSDQSSISMVLDIAKMLRQSHERRSMFFPGFSFRSAVAVAAASVRSQQAAIITAASSPSSVAAAKVGLMRALLQRLPDISTLPSALVEQLTSASDSLAKYMQQSAPSTSAATLLSQWSAGERRFSNGQTLLPYAVHAPHKFKRVGHTVTPPLKSTSELALAVISPGHLRRRRKSGQVIVRQRPVPIIHDFHSILSPLSRLVISVDIETTGLSVGNCRIVEFAACVLSPVHSEFCRLVDPGCSIPQKAVNIHGIGNSQVAGQATFDAVWDAFVAWVAAFNAVEVVLLSYKGFTFDFRVIAAECQRFGRDLVPVTPSGAASIASSWVFADLYPHVCGHHKLKRLFEKELGDSKQRTLDAVYFGVFKKTVPHAHCALGDARATAELHSYAATSVSVSAASGLPTASSPQAPLLLHVRSLQEVLTTRAQTAAKAAFASSGRKRSRKSAASAGIAAVIHADDSSIIPGAAPVDHGSDVTVTRKRVAKGSGQSARKKKAQTASAEIVSGYFEDVEDSSASHAGLNAAAAAAATLTAAENPFAESGLPEMTHQYTTRKRARLSHGVLPVTSSAPPSSASSAT
jgi:DNA polymerase III epsilon subunit-like protein